MECEELKKIVEVWRAKITTKRMSCHPEYLSFILIQFMIIIFSFTRLLWQKMIYDISEFQKGNFQGSHKIFVKKVEKYRLIGWSWMTGEIVSLLAETENIVKTGEGNKYFNFERYLWDIPVTIPRKQYRVWDESYKCLEMKENSLEGRKKKRSKNWIQHWTNIYSSTYSLIHSV